MSPRFSTLCSIYMKVLRPPLCWNPGFTVGLHSQSIIPTWSRALRLALVKEQCVGRWSLLSRSTQASGGYRWKSGQIRKSEFDDRTSSFEWRGTSVSVWQFLFSKLYTKALKPELSYDERETVALSPGKLERVAWTPRTQGQGHIQHIKDTLVSRGWNTLSFWVLTRWRW